MPLIFQKYLWMSLSKFAVYSLKRKFLDNLVSAIKFVILTNESIDEAGRAQLAQMFAMLTQLHWILKKSVFLVGNLAQLNS